jgi:hypothetical protein
MLDEQLLTPEYVLSYCFRGIGSVPPPIEAIASLLVPLGIPPDRIASIRFSGFWAGDQSDRHASIVESYQHMLQTATDPGVHAVAEAGIAMFSRARDDAAARERIERVRGYR